MTSKNLRHRARRRGGVLVAIGVGAALGMAGLSPLIPAQADTPIYNDTSYTFEERAADLVGRMTFAQKVLQFDDGSPGIPGLGVIAYDWWNEALHGVVTSGTTMYPSAPGIASTWNRSLVNQMGSQIGDEARAWYNGTQRVKGLTYWSPTVNIGRDPRWGRADESYGEDPYLVGQIGGEYTKGMQGTDPKYMKAASTPKHFFANNSESNRRNGNAVVTERELREYYTPAFAYEVGPEVKARSFMTAYNRANGVPISSSYYFLETLAKRTWGFDGHITSDCSAVQDSWNRHHWIPDGWDHAINATEGVMWTLKAGTDIDCQDNSYNTEVRNAYNAGLITDADIDSELVRMFTTRFMFGEFDPAGQVVYASSQYSEAEQRQAPDHQATALLMAEEAPVLLKNDPIGGFSNNDPTLPGRAGLPLTAQDAANLVVVGYMANTFTAGGYSGNNPVDQRSILTGIRQVAEQVNPNATVTFFNGVTPSNTGKPGVTNVQFRSSSDRGVALKTLVPGTNGMPSHLVEPVPLDSISHWEGWMGISWGQGSLGNANSVWKGYFQAYVDVPVGTDELCLTYNGNGAVGATFDVYSGPTASGPMIARIPANGGTQAGANNSSCNNTGSTNAVATGLEPGPQTLTYVYNPGTLGAHGTSGQPGTPYAMDLSPADEQTIREASAVIVVLGTRTTESAEEMDRVTIDMPKFQDEMARRVAALNRHTVVYMQTVGQMNIERFRSEVNVPSIIWSTYNGQSQGIAAGNLLFGKTNPSGHLTFSWYSNEEDLASIWDYQITPDTATGHKGRSYLYFTGRVSYPFGHGLSYSKFSYSNLRLDKNAVVGDDTLTATVDVTNSSSVPGKDVVQLYVKAPHRTDGVVRPIRELKGFEKISLGAYETRSVPISIKMKDLWYWDEAASAATWDLGTWELRMGGSSVSGLTTNFALIAPPAPALQTVITVPDGLVMNTSAPNTPIHSELSASRLDQTFYDLSDPNVTVTYSSKDPSVAVVDARGSVWPVGVGATTITATVTADGATKSDDFAVLVEGDDAERPVIDFPDQIIELGAFANAVQLSAQTALAPAGAEVTYEYLLNGIHEENTAGATVTPGGFLQVSQPGVVTVNVKATITADGQTPIIVTENAKITVIGTQSQPVAQIEVVPPPASGVYTEPPEMTVEAIVGDYTENALVEVSIDGGAWFAVSSSFSVTGDGQHTVSARVTDELGRTSAVATAEVNIDTTGPTSPTAVIATGIEAVLTLTPADPDVASIEFSPDGVHWFDYTEPVSIIGTVFYRALDAAGNAGPLRFISVPGVTPPPPIVNPTPPGPITVNPPELPPITVNPPDIPPITVDAPTLPPITVPTPIVTVTTSPPQPAPPTVTAPAPEPPVMGGAVQTVKAATPRIKGTAKVGRKLSVVKGSWTSGSKFTFRWYANGKAIKGATGPTLKLTKKLAGKKITVRLTGWKSGWASASAVSKATKKVAKK
ncbi:MAG: glycoside hydrolase family 3 C-terminal domain-containing protein [Bifidobacteriaceae bacterium]|nr:glycoside hydrolase family 3 C-terminal domain-containing protein [Bifidobacteriaceae bacterium]